MMSCSPWQVVQTGASRFPRSSISPCALWLYCAAMSAWQPPQVSGVASLGEANHLFPGCVIGAHPQDTSYRDSPTRVEIGDGNTFREHCTVNRGTEKEEGVPKMS